MNRRPQTRKRTSRSQHPEKLKDVRRAREQPAPGLSLPFELSEAVSSLQMDLPDDPTIEEVLLDAIQSEIDTRETYLHIAKVSPHPAVRKKLRDLADRELVHRARLERRYKELTGKVPPELSIRSNIDLPKGAETFDLQHALKFALEHERGSESDYRFLAERTPASPLKNLYMELAEQEWKHKREVENEYQASLSPDQFFLDG